VIPSEVIKQELPSKVSQVEAVCKLLQSREQNFVVAGGGARDTALGVEPKDFDVIIYGWGNDTEEVSDLLDLYNVVLAKHAYDNLLPYAYMPSYHDAAEGGDFGSRLYGVYKIGDVDVIVSRCGSWSQVLSEFDFNLNQFYFPSSIPRYSGQYSRDPSDFMAYPYEPRFTPEAASYFPVEFREVTDYEDLLTLHTVRADASDGRKAYMMQKHAALYGHIMDYIERMSENT
jgi:hypothetical protein